MEIVETMGDKTRISANLIIIPPEKIREGQMLKEITNFVSRLAKIGKFWKTSST